MSDSPAKDVWVIHTDGGARGNPGPAAYAYVIEAPGEPVVEAKGYLGQTTNNIAEYTALVKALEHAQALGAKRLEVRSDSELMVQQMNGKYKVRNEGLLPLFRQARESVEAFDAVTIRHIYREQNKRADQLCNEALDDPRRAESAPKPTPRSAAVAPTPAPAPAPSPRAQAIGQSLALRRDALAVLREAAQAWADDEDDALTPEQVWDRLWNLVRAAQNAG